MTSPSVAQTNRDVINQNQDYERNLDLINGFLEQENGHNSQTEDIEQDRDHLQTVDVDTNLNMACPVSSDQRNTNYNSTLEKQPESLQASHRMNIGSSLVRSRNNLPIRRQENSGSKVEQVFNAMRETTDIENEKNLRYFCFLKTCCC